MSEREEQAPQEQDTQEHEAEQEVQGVDTDPDGQKSLEVDTTERLSAKDDEPDHEDIPDEELEKDREERLDPENRPETAEVDNSQRDFNPETGLFEDSEIEPPEGAPFATTDAESPKSSDDGDGDDDDASAADDGQSTPTEPKDREESTDADQSKEAKESKDTEG